MKSYFRDRYQSVELNIKMSITPIFILGSYKTRCCARSNSKFLMFFICISDCSKTIHGKYKKMLFANDTD